MTDRKTAIDLAAESPDPAVRGVALRRRTLVNEIEKIDSFFSMYESVVGKMTAEGLPPEAAATQPAKAIAPTVVKDSGPSPFSDAVQAVLRGYSEPVSLSALYDVMKETHPALAGANKESLRQKLYRNQKFIVLVNGKGYALPGAE